MQADSTHRWMKEKDPFHVWVFCTHWSFKTSPCHDAIADSWKLYSNDVLYIQWRLATWITTVLFSGLTGLLCSHRVIPHWLRLLGSTVTSKCSVGAYMCICMWGLHNFIESIIISCLKVKRKLKISPKLCMWRNRPLKSFVYMIMADSLHYGLVDNGRKDYQSL